MGDDVSADPTPPIESPSSAAIRRFQQTPRAVYLPEEIQAIRERMDEGHSSSGRPMSYRVMDRAFVLTLCESHDRMEALLRKIIRGNEEIGMYVDDDGPEVIVDGWTQPMNDEELRFIRRLRSEEQADL